jgi:hypothetical protein
MRTLTFVLISFFCAAECFAEDKAPEWLNPKESTPGALTYLFNVTGLDAYRDRFHCLLTDYGLDPTVMVIVRGEDELESPAVVKLLQDLDAAVAKNTIKRLHAFVVVTDPSIKDIVKDDVPRYQLRRKVLEFAKDEKNKLNGGVRVPIGLCTEGQMEKFPLDKDAAVTIVFYNNHTLGFSKTFSKDQLNEQEAAKTVKDGLAKVIATK